MSGYDNGSGMAEAFEAIYRRGMVYGEGLTSVTHCEIGGRLFLKDGEREAKEIMPIRPALSVGEFGSIRDFGEAVVRYGTLGPAEVCVESKAATAFLRPRCTDLDRECLVFRAYTGALPPESQLDYTAFCELLDSYTGRIDEEKDLRAGLRVLRAVKIQSIRFEDRGAYTHTSLEASANVEAKGPDLPKIVHFHVPYGDPTYETALCYRLGVGVSGDSLAFRLISMPHVDMRREVFVRRAIDELREVLNGTEHHVYRGTM